MNKYLVLYKDALNYRYYADFATMKEAEECLERLRPNYLTQGIVEVRRPNKLLID